MSLKIKAIENGILPENYHLYVDDNTAPLLCYLTHDLLKNVPKRDIVVLPDSDIAVKNLLDANQLADYDQFVRKIKSFHIIKENVSTFKKMVIDIYNYRDKYNFCSAAIYKDGAIPVFLTQKTVRLYFRDETYEVQVALFPNLNQTKYRGRLNGPTENGDQFPDIKNKYFLSSLKINTELYFYKYFADIANQLTDLFFKSSLSLVFKRAKTIEGILGRSVGVKLEALKRDENFSHTNNALIQAVDIKISYILFLLNELYNIVGLTPKQAYRDELRRFQAMNAFSKPDLLLDLFAGYESGSHLPKRELYSDDEALYDATFLLSQAKKYINRTNLPLSKYSKILLQGNTSSRIAAELTQFFLEEARDLDNLHFIEGTEIPLKNLVWYSDCIFALISSATKSTQLADIKEVIQYANDSKKEVIYFIEQGTTLESVGISAPENSRIINFIADDLDSLSFKDKIRELLRKVIINHTTELLIGWLSQGEKNNSLAISILNYDTYQKGRHQFYSKNEWVGLAHDLSSGMVKDAISFSERRTLSFIDNRGNTQKFACVRKMGKDSFTGGIYDVIRAIAHRISESDKEELLVGVLKASGLPPRKFLN